MSRYRVAFGLALLLLISITHAVTSSASRAFPWPEFDDLFRKLAAKVGPDIRIYKLMVNQYGAADVWIQNPRKPAYIDSYEYDDGEMKGPIPIKFEKYPTMAEIEEHLSPRNVIDFAKLPALADAACLAAKLPDANVTGFRLLPGNARSHWLPIWEFSLEWRSKSAIVEFDVNGGFLREER